MRVLWAFLKRDLINESSYKLSFFLQLFSIFPVVLMFFFLSRLVGSTISGPLQPYGGSYFPFVLIGISVQNYLTQSLSSFSGSLRESQLSGTLEAVLSAPISLGTFLLGSILYTFALNSVKILIYLLIGALLFGAGLDWARLPSAFIIIVLTVTSFASLGIISASFIILFKKGDPLNYAFSVLSWLVGGVYYPISVLPEWLQKAALFVPMTHSLEALRQCLLSGRDLSAVTGHLLLLGAWTGIGLPVGLLCFSRAIRRARVQGTLGHY